MKGSLKLFKYSDVKLKNISNYISLNHQNKHKGRNSKKKKIKLDNLNTRTGNLVPLKNNKPKSLSTWKHFWCKHWQLWTRDQHDAFTIHLKQQIFRARLMYKTLLMWKLRVTTTTMMMILLLWPANAQCGKNWQKLLKQKFCHYYYQLSKKGNDQSHDTVQVKNNKNSSTKYNAKTKMKHLPICVRTPGTHVDSSLGKTVVPLSFIHIFAVGLIVMFLNVPSNWSQQLFLIGVAKS